MKAYIWLVGDRNIWHWFELVFSSKLLRSVATYRAETRDNLTRIGDRFLLICDGQRGGAEREVAGKNVITRRTFYHFQAPSPDFVTPRHTAPSCGHIPDPPPSSWKSVFIHRHPQDLTMHSGAIELPCSFFFKNWFTLVKYVQNLAEDFFFHWELF